MNYLLLIEFMQVQQAGLKSFMARPVRTPYQNSRRKLKKNGECGRYKTVNIEIKIIIKKKEP